MKSEPMSVVSGEADQVHAGHTVPDLTLIGSRNSTSFDYVVSARPKLRRDGYTEVPGRFDIDR